MWCSQVMLRVTDLDASIKYYTEALGCTLLRKKDNPEYKYTLAFLGYGPEGDNLVFELTHNWCCPPLLFCSATVFLCCGALSAQGICSRLEDGLS